MKRHGCLYIKILTKQFRCEPCMTNQTPAASSQIKDVFQLGRRGHIVMFCGIHKTSWETLQFQFQTAIKAYKSPLWPLTPLYDQAQEVRLKFLNEEHRFRNCEITFIFYFVMLNTWKSQSVHHEEFWLFYITIPNELSSDTLKPLKIPTNGYWKYCKMLAYSQLRIRVPMRSDEALNFISHL